MIEPLIRLMIRLTLSLIHGVLGGGASRLFAAFLGTRIFLCE